MNVANFPNYVSFFTGTQLYIIYHGFMIRDGIERDIVIRFYENIIGWDVF